MEILETIADAVAFADWVPQIDPKDDRGWLQIAWDALRRGHREGQHGFAETSTAPSRRKR